MSEPMLRLRGVTKSFPTPGRRTRHEVLRGIDLDLPAGTIVGLVGTSGCGKSTLARICVGLAPPDGGQVLLADGTDLAHASPPLWRSLRPGLQMVYQDPFAAFDPRLRLAQGLVSVVRRCDRVSTAAALARVHTVWAQVGLAREQLDRRPDQLSGGQLQRAALVRALLVRPRLLVADEIVSALDVSSTAAIVDLLRSTAHASDRATLFVSHDLGVVATCCDRVAVMDGGVVVEEGSTASVMGSPQHRRTRELLAAVPRLP